MSIEEKVKNIVARIFEIDEEKITRETRFVEDLFAKSINIVEMTAEVEYTFDIEMPMAEARKNKTVGQAIDFIKNLMLKKNSSQ